MENLKRYVYREINKRSSYKGRKENALALGADERRGKLR